MDHDPTEMARRLRVAAAHVNAEPTSRASLEALHGRVWSTDELRADFEAEYFLAPFVVVRRRADGVRGTLMFTHMPRFYFDFQPL